MYLVIEVTGIEETLKRRHKMEGRIGVAIAPGLLVSLGNAKNVIVQWSPHNPNDYVIEKFGDEMCRCCHLREYGP